MKVKCDLDVRRRARYVLLDVFHGHVGMSIRWQTRDQRPASDQGGQGGGHVFSL